MAFELNRNELTKNGRVVLGDWVESSLDHLENAIQELEKAGETSQIVQRGRVVALRATDTSRMYSAFKAALYLGKYDDMQNTERFLTKMVKAHHSYEPIRGESILFMFIGVGKPVYDHMVTYTVGRPTRIAGGQRANLPWGYEVPVEAKNSQAYIDRAMPLIQEVVELTKRESDREQMQAARSLLPVGYIMPPFLMEFSEEALIKSVFRQRLFERGAQGATVDVVSDMWECCMALDQEKWETLKDYHGPHTVAWEKTMRTLRDKQLTLQDLLALAGESEQQADPATLPLYELLMQTVGKEAPTMWEKMNK
ncbi:hypothetical protein ACQCN2_20605 [Brevibacillus ginsengisoli]|uniref:hypothetical protein n=1 Tax=Brevibacillus ginsengisoli TaxID=363854 RepID=UPI003CF1A1BB